MAIISGARLLNDVTVKRAYNRKWLRVSNPIVSILSMAQATVYTKPQQIIHGWVEHLMLERLVCNTYCVELHRPEGDRFPVVRIQIFALPVHSHLAGFFKA